jgi:hypothetical protein
MKQTTLIGVGLRWEKVDDDHRALIIEVSPQEAIVVPMTNEIAQTVGQQASAPYVSVAPASALQVIEGGRKSA